MNDDQIVEAIELLGGAVQSIIDALGAVDDALAVQLHQDLRDAATDLSDALKAVAQ